MWLEPITHCWMGMNFNTRKIDRGVVCDLDNILQGWVPTAD